MTVYLIGMLGKSFSDPKVTKAADGLKLGLQYLTYIFDLLPPQMPFLIFITSQGDVQCLPEKKWWVMHKPRTVSRE